MSLPKIRFGVIAKIFLGLATATCHLSGWAGPILAGNFYQFSFTTAGAPAQGCQPADPSGNFCISSSGTLTLEADAPAWTFSAPASGATFTVVDAFTNGDQFEIFDFGASIGLTSLPVGNSDCGDDPVPCLADLAMSSGVFNLGAGAHSITIIPSASPSDSGSGYFLLSDAVINVPEPGTLLLVLLSMVLLVMRGRNSKKEKILTQ